MNHDADHMMASCCDAAAFTGPAGEAFSGRGRSTPSATAVLSDVELYPIRDRTAAMMMPEAVTWNSFGARSEKRRRSGNMSSQAQLMERTKGLFERNGAAGVLGVVDTGRSEAGAGRSRTCLGGFELARFMQGIQGLSGLCEFSSRVGGPAERKVFRLVAGVQRPASFQTCSWDDSAGGMATSGSRGCATFLFCDGVVVGSGGRKDLEKPPMPSEGVLCSRCAGVGDDAGNAEIRPRMHSL